MVRPQTLFPFPRQAVYDAASKASCRAAISIEMSMGQLVEDVELSIRGPSRSTGTANAAARCRRPKK